MTKKKLTPIKSIRQKCLDCCCGQMQEVRLCNIEKCALFPYRMGKRPITLPFEEYQKKKSDTTNKTQKNEPSEAGASQ